MTPDSLVVSVLFGGGALILVAVLAFGALRKNVGSRQTKYGADLIMERKMNAPAAKSDDDAVKAAIAAEIASTTMF